MKLNLSPIRILIFYLIVMMLISSCSFALFSAPLWFSQIRNFVLIFAAAYGTYRALLLTKKITPTRWEHRVITTSILFLLIDPFFPWWIFPLLGVLTEVLQRFIRLPTGPLMNPAALALFLVSIFGYAPAWMGTSFSPRIPIVSGGMSVAMFLTVPLAGYVAYKYKKLPIVATFVVVFALCYALFIQANPLFLVIEGTVAFFALVMAVEPKTSPVLRNQQIVYGLALGVLIPIAIKFYFIEPYCGPLILCNLVFNLYRNRNYLKSKWAPKSPTPISTPTPPVVAPTV